MSMELRQLRYFVAVAEEQSFGRAAKRLRMSQPPLSIQIKGLEKELEVELLDRTTRRVMLTDSGRVFLSRAKEILNAVEQARLEVRNTKSGLRGQLEVGFVSSATLSLLPPALRLFRQRFGGVELELRELTSAQQMEALYEGGIRVGLVRLPLRAPGILLEPVLEESLLVALPSGHHLEAMSSVPLPAVVDERLIFFTRHLIPGLHEQIIEMFRSVNAYPKVAQHAVHLQTIVGLVASGIGVAILPDSAERFKREGVVYRPLVAPGATTWLGLARLEQDNSALVENFVQTVREVAEDQVSSDSRRH